MGIFFDPPPLKILDFCTRLHFVSFVSTIHPNSVKKVSECIQMLVLFNHSKKTHSLSFFQTKIRIFLEEMIQILPFWSIFKCFTLTRSLSFFLKTMSSQMSFKTCFLVPFSLLWSRLWQVLGFFGTG